MSWKYGEPWKAVVEGRHFWLEDANGFVMGKDEIGDDYNSRIALCVNFLRDIPDDVLRNATLVSLQPREVSGSFAACDAIVIYEQNPGDPALPGTVLTKEDLTP